MWKKIKLENSELKKKQLYKELKEHDRIYCSATNAIKGTTPIEDHRLPSQALCIDLESNKSRKLQVEEIPSGKNQDVRGNLARQELTDEGAMEIISIAHGGKEEPITSPITIAENDIKTGITND